MLNWFKDIPKPIWVFTSIWFVLGCVQSALMDLHPDEAYYWQMSRFMDWGYFHQPPMIAVFIKIGYALFQNELGVRLVTTLTSALGILMLFKLSEPKDSRPFLLIYLGFILTHAGVFMAVPDSPLIFFTLVFLVLLRGYLKKDSLLTALAIGVVAAALMYSKYHAVVLIGSVILSSPKLLARKTFWAAGILAVLLFVPHILWQMDHDFVSFKYHWLLRNKSTWSPALILNYIGSEFILLGPVGLIAIYSLFKAKVHSQFDRALLFVLVGFFGFFLFISFKGRVEANWTASAFLPLIILTTKAVDQNPSLERILKPVALVVAVILFAGRVYLCTPIAGQGIKLNFPMVGWSEWATAIKEKAAGKPVVFVSSYQLPSQYSFYSGEQGYLLSTINFDGSQFELWDIDEEIEGKDYTLAIPYGDNPLKAVKAENFSPMYIWERENYQSFRKLRFEFVENEISAIANNTLILDGILTNNTLKTINLDTLLKKKPLTYLQYKDGSHSTSFEITCTGCEGLLQSDESKPVSFSLNAPKEPGTYFIRFGLDFELGLAEQNSDFVKLLLVIH